jgi:2-keto-4-pentenoate hydratase/2-oxohepta-3-ene-1,7-dioic acid hydratase in catechol pathway
MLSPLVELASGVETSCGSVPHECVNKHVLRPTASSGASRARVTETELARLGEATTATRTARFRGPAGVTRRGEWTDDGIVAGGRVYDPAGVDVLPPTRPTKVVCQAGGYVDHRMESGYEEVPDRPELFLKTPNCVIGHGNVIELPLGRDDQDRERNWVRGKAFDGSLPAGPVVATPDEVPEDARLELRHNGDVKQETSTDHMIFSVPELVAEISEFVTLEPGDLVATGTPFGPDALSPGDVVEVEFEGVGALRNEVVER